MFSFFSQLIGVTLGSTFLLPLAVILCAFLFEDATIVIVGVLAADGAIPIPVALASLYAGMLLGDLALYAIGRVARTHPRLAHYVDHEFTAPLRSWLESRYTSLVFSGHFVPGWRFTTYVASGFFRLPFSRYFPSAVASGLILGGTLFTVSYLFGSFSAKWVGEVRWGIAALFIVGIFFVARHNVLTYRRKKLELEQSDTGADTRTT
jgi:membrane protein DedA with SNARE-associated domain